MTMLSIQRVNSGLQGEAICPRDKALSHRAAMIGTLIQGETVIEGFSFCDDCRSTLRCLALLGARVQQDPAQTMLAIKGPGHRNLLEADTVLDVGNSGTTIRMMAGIACGIAGLTVFTGDASIRQRPMKRIIDPLKRTGASLGGRCGDRYPPLYVQGQRQLIPLNSTMNVASAQVKSAMIFAALFGTGDSVIVEPEPTRNHTENMLRYVGVDIRTTGKTIMVKPPQTLSPTRFNLPGDPSSAAFLTAAALLIPGSVVTIRDIGLNPLRGGFFQCLERMGASIDTVCRGESFNEPHGDITVCHGTLRGIDISGSMIPALVDEIPVLAVLATQAQGVTTISGAGELRFKESDRLQAITRGLQRMGARITEQDDGMIIEGPVKLRGASLDSAGDHRIAMSFAIAGLVAEGETTLDNHQCIAVSYPGFFQDLAGLAQSTDWIKGAFT